MPTFNAEKTINDSIISVLNQNYKNWELLIIDDCSSDRTKEIIQEYVSIDKRIKLFSTDRPSGGPSTPRNIGIKNSQGKYIAFLDSDDIWLPNKLEEQLNFLLSNNYKFVYSNYEKISYEGKRNDRFIIVRNISTYNDTLKSCEIPCLTVLLDRYLIENRKFKNIGKEDYIMWLEILRDCNTAYNTGKIHALYREANNTRSSNKIKMIHQQWNVIRNIEKQNLIKSIYYLSTYLLKGYLKYLK